MEKMFIEIDENARKREETLKRATQFLNTLIKTLYGKRIGRKVEIPVEGVSTPVYCVTHFGWGKVSDNWSLYVVCVDKDVVLDLPKGTKGETETLWEGYNRPLMELSQRTRLALLDKIPALLREISRILKEDTEQIGQKLDALEDLLGAL